MDSAYEKDKESLFMALCEGLDTPQNVYSDPEEVLNSEWIASMFDKKDPRNWFMKAVPEEIIQYGTVLMIRYYEASDESVQAKIRRKVLHTRNVTELICRFDLEVERIDHDFRESAITGLLHDVARFAQWYHFQTFDDRKSIDHAQWGARLLTYLKEKKEPGFEDLSDEIIDAIRQHSMKECDKPTEIARKIRRADKCIILSEYLADIRESPIEHGAISPQAYLEFMSGLIVSHKSLETPVDRLLQRLSWIYDLDSLEAQNWVLNSGILDELLILLKQATGDEQTDITIGLDQWKQQVHLTSSQQFGYLAA